MNASLHIDLCGAKKISFYTKTYITKRGGKRNAHAKKAGPFLFSVRIWLWFSQLLKQNCLTKSGSCFFFFGGEGLLSKTRYIVAEVSCQSPCLPTVYLPQETLLQKQNFFPEGENAVLDFSPLPLDLTAVAPPRSRRKLPNFPVCVA